MKSRQLSFLPKQSVEHGGDLNKGKRKNMRPLDPKRCVHLVLRSTRAKGQWNLIRHKFVIEDLISATGKRFHVKVLNRANVGNHIHLIFKAPTRKLAQHFMRTLPALIARKVTGARKGKSISGRFWDLLAYTRIVNWGRELEHVTNYIIKNNSQSSEIQK